MAGRSRAAASAPAAAAGESAPRTTAKRKPARKKKAAPPAPVAPAWHSWKTPSEATKFRWAAALVVGLLLSLACWSGEISRLPDGGARLAFRDLKGKVTLGLEWHRGEWPHFKR